MLSPGLRGMPKRPGLQGPELAVYGFFGDRVVSEVQWKPRLKKDARKGRYIMRFIVASEVFELFPGLKLPVAVAEGIHPTTDAPGIETMWQQSWEEAARTASDYRSPQSHPRVAPWREAMSAMGVSGRKFPSSIEALLRRAFKGGEPPRINPLVDFYNAVSLRHVVPAGGFDLEEVDGALELRLTRQEDTFQPLDSSYEVSVEPGEVAYASGNEILTRYFVWKQSRKGLLDESTRSLLLVSEVLGEVESGSGVADAVLEDFADGLRRYFNSEPAVFLVGEENPEVSL
jgi:DNA/RNA-binding domain of Phe-tRNA-synthetase-like protein